MRSVKHLFLAIIAVTALILGGCGDDDDTIVVLSYNGKFLYVNNSATENAVSGFAIRANGALVELAGSPFATGGAGIGDLYAANPIAIARSKKLLFAANTTDSTVTSFTINSNTGALTPVGLPVVSGGTMGGGGSLAVDDDENFLFVGNETTGDVSVLSIAADGTLTPVPGSPFALGAGFGPDGITLNPVGDTLYVAGSGSNFLAVLDVAFDGSLTHIAGSPFAYTAGGAITSFVLSSSTRGFSAATGGVLASYDIDADGAPALLASLIVGGNNQAVTVTRRGRLAVVSGGSSSFLSTVQVASDGTLTLVDGAPFVTAAPTSGYALANPSGRYLYVTEAIVEGVNQIEAFRINSAGALTSIAVYPLTNAEFATGLVIY